MICGLHLSLKVTSDTYVVTERFADKTKIAVWMIADCNFFKEIAFRAIV